ncbi:MAG: aldolase catalytic domain-containing protein [Oscillospiraceae bacterium]|nr:aldolase catalytic domain-containing protein [Oscillospiraceae bacterium]
MAKKGDLLSVRKDIRVVDATIRDGGLCNNFRFDDKFVKDLYEANVKAGVDYMEFGYKASKEIFDEKDFGKWKFCNDADIRKIVGDNKTKLKIAVMADVGRTDFEKDIIPKKDSPIDLIRIATYINTIPAAVEMIEDCAKKGYETTINIMAVSKANTEDIITALDILGNSSVNAFYIVDSYGALYPEQARRLAELYCEKAEQYKKSVGIHAHNNQQLAFANTIEAMTQGVSYLDGTVDGMGRGAGNCALELLLGFLKNPKYKVDPILKIIEQHTHKLREDGVKWGYDIPYMLTGQYNTHPRPAISFVKDDRKDYYKFSNELYDIINS